MACASLTKQAIDPAILLSGLLGAGVGGLNAAPGKGLQGAGIGALLGGGGAGLAGHLGGDHMARYMTREGLRQYLGDSALGASPEGATKAVHGLLKHLTGPAGGAAPTMTDDLGHMAGKAMGHFNSINPFVRGGLVRGGADMIADHTPNAALDGLSHLAPMKNSPILSAMTAEQPLSTPAGLLRALQGAPSVHDAGHTAAQMLGGAAGVGAAHLTEPGGQGENRLSPRDLMQLRMALAQRQGHPMIG
jgi:hypothetical protein